jgi:uncharacterized membrane protein (GlpM family)
MALADILYRFLIGGFVVSVFAALGDLFKPKSFAGLFGAAPSIALATLALAVVKQGRLYAAIECRSMMLGAAAFFVYAQCVSFMLMRLKWPTRPVSLLSLLIWLGMALGLYWCIIDLLQ